MAKAKIKETIEVFNVGRRAYLDLKNADGDTITLFPNASLTMERTAGEKLVNTYPRDLRTTPVRHSRQMAQKTARLEADLKTAQDLLKQQSEAEDAFNKDLSQKLSEFGVESLEDLCIIAKDLSVENTKLKEELEKLKSS